MSRIAKLKAGLEASQHAEYLVEDGGGIKASVDNTLSFICDALHAAESRLADLDEPWLQRRIAVARRELFANLMNEGSLPAGFKI